MSLAVCLKERAQLEVSNVLKRLKGSRSFSVPGGLKLRLLLNSTCAYLLVIVIVIVIAICIISYVPHYLSIYQSKALVCLFACCTFQKFHSA